MKTIYDKKWYRPSEIAELGLIKNSKGKADYYFVLKLIKTKRLRAKNYANGKKPYWLVPEDEIARYHDTVTKII